ncbi:unnamed protein product, partial [marine sediment metagenome]
GEDDIWFKKDAFGEVEVVFEIVDYSSYGLCGVFVFFGYIDSHLIDRINRIYRIIFCP